MPTDVPKEEVLELLDEADGGIVILYSVGPKAALGEVPEEDVELDHHVEVVRFGDVPDGMDTDLE